MTCTVCQRPSFCKPTCAACAYAVTTTRCRCACGCQAPVRKDEDRRTRCRRCRREPTATCAQTKRRTGATDWIEARLAYLAARRRAKRRLSL